jgi:hypothetical protein
VCGTRTILYSTAFPVHVTGNKTALPIVATYAHRCTVEQLTYEEDTPFIQRLTAGIAGGASEQWVRACLRDYTQNLIDLAVDQDTGLFPASAMVSTTAATATAAAAIGSAAPAVPAAAAAATAAVSAGEFYFLSARHINLLC